MEKQHSWDELIMDNIQVLPDRDKKEVLNFIEYLKIKEDQSFIDYVNRRSERAVEDRRRGSKFSSLILPRPLPQTIKVLVRQF